MSITGIINESHDALNNGENLVVRCYKTMDTVKKYAVSAEYKTERIKAFAPIEMNGADECCIIRRWLSATAANGELIRAALLNSGYRGTPQNV